MRRSDLKQCFFLFLRIVEKFSDQYHLIQLCLLKDLLCASRLLALYFLGSFIAVGCFHINFCDNYHDRHFKLYLKFKKAEHLPLSSTHSYLIVRLFKIMFGKFFAAK